MNVIKSSLKDIKKAIKRNYPRPFEVSNIVKTDSDGSVTFVVIKDFTDQTVAQFKYVKEDGALLTGFLSSPVYQEKYEQHFPKLDEYKNFDYYQKVLDLFHENNIFKALFTPDIERFKLMRYMFKEEQTVIRKRDLDTDFRKISPTGFRISIQFQYYVNESFELTPRMKINFEFPDFGRLIIYYDYEKNELRFGESQFVEDKTFDEQEPMKTQYLSIPSFGRAGSFSGFFLVDDLSFHNKAILKTLDNNESHKLFGIEQNQSIKTFDDLETIFERWMIEIGVLINKKFSILYKLDETFEADSKDNVIENFNLVKMTLI